MTVDHALVAGIAVEDGDQGGQIGVRIIAQAHPRGGEGIGRAAARQVGPGDGRPIVAEERLARLRGEEFAVGGDLPDPDGEARGPTPFQPQLRQPRGGIGLDVADGDESLEAPVAQTAGVVDLEGVGEGGDAVEAGEPAEIDGQDSLELAGIDRAVADAAGGIAQHLVGGEEREVDPARAQGSPYAAGIAELSQ